METKVHKNIDLIYYIARDLNFNKKSNTTEINILEYAFLKWVRKTCMSEPCINGEKIFEQYDMVRTLDSWH